MDITVNPKLFRLLIFVPFFLLSLGIHEFAHAYTANKFGDDTAKNMGRLTLNPLKHLDLFGSIIIPLISMLSGFAIIGWAKPVPVNPNKFRNPQSNDIVVSIMGPISNLLFAVVLLFAMVIVPPSLKEYLLLPVYFNVFLFYFNLIPLPPLDGSHIVNGLFPNSLYTRYFAQIARWSLLILMLFIYSPLWKYFMWLVNATLGAMISVV